MKNVFSEIRSRVGVRPQAASAAVNGVAIDTLNYDSAMAVIEIGATTGSPTSFTADAKIQESADGSTGWADISGATITQQSAINKSAQIKVENLRTNQKRYLRIVITPAFVGGITPTLQISGHILLGQATQQPVGNTSAGE